MKLGVQTSELQNMDSQIEIEVGSSNTDTILARCQRTSSGKVNALCKAAISGDWKYAESALCSIGASDKITTEENTALHVAVDARQTDFVRELVERLTESELELKNKYGYTAFCNAAVSGVVEIAEVMYQKNKNLPGIRSTDGDTPLKLAIWYGNTEMVEYLYQITPIEGLEHEEYMNILVELIHADMYVIASDILIRDKRVTSPTIDRKSALQALAKKDFSYNHKFQGRIRERLVGILATIPCIPYFKRKYRSLQMRRQGTECAKKLWKKILMTLLDPAISNPVKGCHIFHEAAKVGNVEFLALLTSSYPNLIYGINEKSHSIFHVAVLNRQEKVFSLFYQTEAAKHLITRHIDNERNNILHLAAILAPPSRLNIVFGAALQMQRELQWFKEVEKIVRPSHVQMKNYKEKTPWELFISEHEKLRGAGEGWMKDTATSCMVVTTLVATLVFAAAFTLPGGYKEEKGVPIFLHDRWFTIFVISDALAMFSSTTSIMAFLSLYTAQYREIDFLISLPAKLMVGLIALFASIIFMVLTFSTTFFLVYKEESQGTLPKFVAAVVGLPIALYALLNFRLLISLFHSTFFVSRFMFRPGKHRLF